MKKSFNVISVVPAVIIVIIALLWFGDDIGISKAAIETDSRKSQNISKDWAAQKEEGKEIVALLFYPPDKSHHIFSIYVNRPGLSFGYFFRGSGPISTTEHYITEFTINGFNERAFVSMNEEQVVRMEIDDGNSLQTTEIDPGAPFCFVLSSNVGSVTFIDMNGNTVETRESPL